MGKSAPSAPDPKETAAGQAAANRSTAITQQQLNMVNQNNPWGSVGYEQTGTAKHFDELTGKWVETPTYTQTTTLSPEQQAIFDQSQAAELNLAGLANEQSLKIRDLLNTPFEFTNRDAETWAYDLASPRILQQQSQNEEQLRSVLANKGLREGSAAWNSEMQRLTSANTDQLNQLALTGRSQAFSEALAQRNQPINEITALLSGSQVSNPAQMSGPTPQTSVGGVDYSGLVQNKYNADMAAYQSKMGGIGGLFGLGGQLLGGVFSDRRLKHDINRIGTTDGGTPIYTFKYKGSDVVHMGVMAQDVPEAQIKDTTGYLRVDYARVS